MMPLMEKNLDNINAFDFNLPEQLIATKPPVPRDSARLLLWPTPKTEYTFKDLPNHLKAGDLLILNNTKVIPARLHGFRQRLSSQGDPEGQLNVELLLHRPQKDAVTWESFAKPAKRFKEGHTIHFENSDVTADVLSRNGDRLILRFNAASSTAFDDFLEAQGDMPLPPYIEREDGATHADKDDYQTVFAQHKGSVAAPTAGLHFTPELLNNLKNKGVAIDYVTLHVGAGTFQPVRDNDINKHTMHAEWGRVTPELADKIKQTKAAGGRIIAVGTTSLRLLESAAASGHISAFDDETAIFIRPGFTFNVTDMLITNFHLPKSTLLMLVSAFIGYDETMALYQHAISEKYKFYSYGDGMLLSKKS